MKKQDELLDQRIQDELGIDVKKYRNQEVVDNFSDLIIFPIYVVKWGIRPVIIAFILFITGFFIFDLISFEYVLYAIFGLILFLITGFFTGVIFVMRKMKNDILGIINYSLDILKSSVKDLAQLNSQITKENRGEVLSLLFNGIIRLVTVPVVSGAISNKIPLVGFLFVGLFQKVLSMIAKKVTFNEDKIAELEIAEGKEADLLSAYVKHVSTVSKSLERVVDFTFKIAGFPIFTVFIISLVLLLVFIYFIN